MSFLGLKHYLTKAPPVLHEAIPFYSPKSFHFRGKNFEFIDTSTKSDVILFIHGNPTSKEMWFPIIQRLENQYRCIAIDLFPNDLEDSYRPELSTSADLINDLLKNLGLSKVTLVTHDWGVTIGLKSFSDKPHLFSNFIFMEGLFYPISLKHYFFVPWFLAVIGKTPLLNELLLVHGNIFVRWLLPLGCMRKLPKTWHVEFLKVYRSKNRRKIIKHWIGQIPFLEDYNLDQLRTQLYSSEVPKLVFTANPGLAMKELVVKEMTSECKNLKRIDLGSGVHFLPLDYPLEIANGIHSFLSL